MRLLYLSLENLQNQNFIKLLVSDFDFKKSSILIHEPFGKKLQDTRFVTKRISSLLGESLVPNNAFSGDQRLLLSLNSEGKPELRVDLIRKLMDQVPVFILNSIMSGPEGPHAVEASSLIPLFQASFPITETLLFTQNPLSPLAARREIIQSQADFDRLLASYEEEKSTLRLALAFRPAAICSPSNFALR